MAPASTATQPTTVSASREAKSGSTQSQAKYAAQ